MVAVHVALAIAVLAICAGAALNGLGAAALEVAPRVADAAGLLGAAGRVVL